MPSLRDIKRRIRSVKNTSQITRAMEMVAGTKMRRAQQAVLASRAYSEKMREVIGALSRLTEGAELSPLLARREPRSVLYILLTSDRGLAGSLNTNVLSYFARQMLDRNLGSQVVTVGRKGRDFAVRRRLNLVSEFTNLSERPTYLDVLPISRVAIDAYLKDEVQEVRLIYQQFVSTLVQRPSERVLLPVSELSGPSADEDEKYLEYIFEPRPAEVLAALLPRYVEVQIYQAVLEAQASEQSARMVAMRNATQNAKELVNELTLSYNKARQESITKELLEISSGAQALTK